MVKKMIKRRSFLVGLLAAPAIAKSSVAEVPAAPISAMGIPIAESQSATLVAKEGLTPYGREFIESLICRTADFSNSDRIATRLARHQAQSK